MWIPVLLVSIVTAHLMYNATKEVAAIICIVRNQKLNKVLKYKKKKKDFAAIHMY